MKLTEEILNYAVVGGAILGGGGGGSRESGMRVGKAALMYASPELISIDEVDPEMLIVTASAVGAPAAKTGMATPRDYVHAVQMLEQQMGCKMGGIITNENGGTATINGWIQSAVLGIPLIDAPCNGRAHPTGTMGSMGLNNVAGFVSYQAAVGGNPDLGNYMELTVSGSLGHCASMIRKTADAAGGLVAVARNPVKASYVKAHGAVGGVSHAIDTGRAHAEGMKKSPQAAIEAVAAFLKGKIVVSGKVDELKLETVNAFDVGRVLIGRCEMTFWNEYMTLENGAERLMTFPDLIATFDLKTGLPVTSAEIAKGQEIAIVATSRSNIRLGAGCIDPALLKEIEPIINKTVL
ncbi:MAG: DUF917 family protein [Deferribacteraceae bacterium]|jgi:DUF917 family protein|nr:DUF917 family protein [Deferribacteraceae bacterium]